MIDIISIGKSLQYATCARCARSRWRVDNTGRQVLLPGRATLLAKLSSMTSAWGQGILSSKAGKAGRGQGVAWSGNLAKLTSSSVSWLRCIE